MDCHDLRQGWFTRLLIFRHFLLDWRYFDWFINKVSSLLWNRSNASIKDFIFKKNNFIHNFSIPFLLSICKTVYNIWKTILLLIFLSYYFWYDRSIQYPVLDIIKLHYKILSVLKLCKSGVQLVPGLSLGFIVMLRTRESDLSRIHMLVSEIMANSESLLSLWPLSSVVRLLLPECEIFP